MSFAFRPMPRSAIAMRFSAPKPTASYFTPARIEAKGSVSTTWSASTTRVFASSPKVSL